jgi:hypothetical protein
VNVYSVARRARRVSEAVAAFLILEPGGRRQPETRRGRVLGLEIHWCFRYAEYFGFWSHARGWSRLLVKLSFRY